MNQAVLRATTQFLFIDDDPINNLICRLTVDMVLGNVKSQSFTNPQLALEYLQTSFLKDGHPNRTVLLLDINMPVMSGWEFLDRFDDLSPLIKNSISICVLSSSVDERDKVRSYANKNVREFLVKPLTKEDILRICDEVPENYPEF
jgi:response regulator RpfG family c-di-GMP phosphodiesterase